MFILITFVRIKNIYVLTWSANCDQSRFLNMYKIELHNTQKNTSTFSDIGCNLRLTLEFDNLKQ